LIALLSLALIKLILRGCVINANLIAAIGSSFGILVAVTKSLPLPEGIIPKVVCSKSWIPLTISERVPSPPKHMMVTSSFLLVNCRVIISACRSPWVLCAVYLKFISLRKS
jgi:hypothetical protein